VRGAIFFSLVFSLISWNRTAAQTGTIFWCEGNTGRIGRVLTDGSGMQIIHTGLPGPVAVDVDPVNRHLYWVEAIENTGKIRRSDFDGTNVVDLVTNLDVPSGVSLDLVNEKMYWTTFDPFGGTAARANLDGTNPQTIATGLLGGAWGIEANPGGGKIYWGMPIGDLYWANLDGTSPQVVYSDSNDNINGVTVDPTGAGALFFTSAFPVNKVYTADLAGGNAQTIALPPQPQPLGIDYEPTLSLLVWANKFGANGNISSSKPNGSQFQVVLPGVDAFDVAVVPFAVPQPGTLALTMLGFAVLAGWARSRRR
jgi:hypothetical protein